MRTDFKKIISNSFFKFLIFTVCVCCVCAGAHKDKKRALDPLDLDICYR